MALHHQSYRCGTCKAARIGLLDYFNNIGPVTFNVTSCVQPRSRERRISAASGSSVRLRSSPRDGKLSEGARQAIMDGIAKVAAAAARDGALEGVAKAAGPKKGAAGLTATQVEAAVKAVMRGKGNTATGVAKEMATTVAAFVAAAVKKEMKALATDLSRTIVSQVRCGFFIHFNLEKDSSGSLRKD